MALAAATSWTVAATASGRRFSAPPSRRRTSSSPPHLPPGRASCPPSDKLSVSVGFRVKDPDRLQSTPIRASPSEETSSPFEVEEVFSDLKEQWDSIEDKSSLLVIGTGAVVAVWLSSAVVNAISSVPLLPTLMEVVGLGYTGWFVYRYLLFKSSRKELANEVEALKNKITGSE